MTERLHLFMADILKLNPTRCPGEGGIRLCWAVLYTRGGIHCVLVQSVFIEVGRSRMPERCAISPGRMLAAAAQPSDVLRACVAHAVRAAGVLHVRDGRQHILHASQHPGMLWDGCFFNGYLYDSQLSARSLGVRFCSNIFFTLANTQAVYDGFQYPCF
jgi:hypothetical protein